MPSSSSLYRPRTSSNCFTTFMKAATTLGSNCLPDSALMILAASKADIGGLAIQPDYVAGVEAVRKNQAFLDEKAQTEILNGVLASVKLF